MSKIKTLLLWLTISVAALSWVPTAAQAAGSAAGLSGTWVLVAADVRHPDGSREHDYGAHPDGLLMVDAEGRYSLQIFKSERTAFASADKALGSAEDYRTAVLGSSTHYGRLTVDAQQMRLTFHIEDASFPNWRGQSQQRQYTLSGDELSYFGVARPNGDIPISVWSRIK